MKATTDQQKNPLTCEIGELSTFEDYKARMELHERWLHQIADKLGTTLV